MDRPVEKMHVNELEGPSLQQECEPQRINSVIAYGAKLLNADWLRQRAFFLNHEGTFGNQEGMIT